MGTKTISFKNPKAKINDERGGEFSLTVTQKNPPNLHMYFSTLSYCLKKLHASCIVQISN